MVSGRQSAAAYMPVDKVKRKPLHHSSKAIRFGAHTVYPDESFAGSYDRPGHQDYQHPSPIKSKMSDTTSSLNFPSKRSLTGQTSFHSCQIPLWTSVWLRKKVLFTIVALFAILLGAFIFLWRYMVVNDGLALTFSTNQNLWVYGPTAFLTIVVSLWRQVDYNTKLMQPWWELKKGESPATKSVLLNYLSPLQIVSFTRAFNHRHYPVVISIAAFVVLKVVVVISTGLLITLPAERSYNVSTSLANTFDANAFFASVAKGQINVATNRPALVASAAPIFAYEAILDSEALSTNRFKDKASQSFLAPRSVGSDGTLSAAVDVFVPNIICEPAQISVSRNKTLLYDVPSCTIQSSTLAADENAAAHCAEGTCKMDLIMTWEQCMDTSGLNVAPLDPNQDQFRMVIRTTNYTLTPSRVEQTGLSYAYGGMEVFVTVCKFNYTVVKGRLSQTLYDGINTLDVPQNSPRGTQFSAFSPVLFLDYVYNAFTTAGLSYEQPSGNVGLLNLIAVTVFQLMSKEMGGSSLKGFLNSTEMSGPASRMFNGVMAQIAHQLILKDANITVPGIYTHSSPRLYLRPLASLGVAIGLSLMVVLGVIMLFIALPGVTSQDPSLMLSQANVLASSSDMQVLLKGEGSSRTSVIKEKLGSSRFSITTDNAVSIEALQSNKPAVNLAEKSKHKNKPKRQWTPYSGRKHATIITIILPLVVIVAIEILYRKSVSNEGFLEVETESTVATHVLRYIAAVIAVAIAAFFTSLDFAVASLSPLSALRYEGSSARSGLLQRLIGRYPPLAFCDAIRHGHKGAAFANLAAFLGSLLTVVVSGLWILDPHVKMQALVRTQTLDSWDISWRNSSLGGNGGNNGASMKFNQIQRGSASVPSTIWKTLVLPRIPSGVVSTSGNLTNAKLNYTLLVPALRPMLDCQVIPRERFVSYPANESFYPTVAFANITIDLPKTCSEHFGGKSTYTFPEVGIIPSLTWYNNMQDLFYNPDDDNISYRQDDVLSNITRSIPRGCPSQMWYFGQVINTTETFELNGTAIYCTQRLQEVKTTVTYIGEPSNLLLSPDYPPVPDEKTAKYLVNGTDGIEVMSYRIEPNLQPALVTLQESALIQQGFLNHFLYGPNGTTLKDIEGPSNTQNFIAAVTLLYQRFMTNVIDMNFRASSFEARAVSKNKFPTGLSNDTVTGYATYYATRIKVNYTAKLVLQIMLAAMTLFASLAYLSVDLRGTSPRDPLSIAGCMAFFADSSIVRKPFIPEGAQFMDEKQLAQLYGRYAFSLGWWDKDDGGGGGGDGSGQQRWLEEEKKKMMPLAMKHGVILEGIREVVSMERAGKNYDEYDDVDIADTRENMPLTPYMGGRLGEEDPRKSRSSPSSASITGSMVASTYLSSTTMTQPQQYSQSYLSYHAQPYQYQHQDQHQDQHQHQHQHQLQHQPHIYHHIPNNPHHQQHHHHPGKRQGRGEEKLKEKWFGIDVGTPLDSEYSTGSKFSIMYFVKRRRRRGMIYQ